MGVPLFDVKTQNDLHAKEALAAFKSVQASNAFIFGPQVGEFECQFSKFVGTKYALGVGSGTDALTFSLKAVGVKAGDEVVVPSFTFISSALCILHNQAIPVFCDVEEDSFNMDPKALEKVITKKTKAIVVVHLFGLPANMTVIKRIAKKYKLKIIEDACQAHGAHDKGTFTGNFGDAGCFSFYPTKNLGGFGDGGMITTRNKKLYEKLLDYRNLGRGNMKITDHYEIGWTSRLDTVQAAVLSIKLKALNASNKSRQAVAKIYTQGLKNLPVICPPLPTKTRSHVYHLYVIRVLEGKRDELRTFLSKKGVSSAVYYAKAIHQQPALQDYKFKKGSLKVTEKLSQEVLALPVFPSMKKSQVKEVIDAIKEFYSHGS